MLFTLRGVTWSVTWSVCQLRSSLDVRYAESPHRSIDTAWPADHWPLTTDPCLVLSLHSTITDQWSMHALTNWRKRPTVHFTRRVWFLTVNCCVRDDNTENQWKSQDRRHRFWVADIGTSCRQHFITHDMITVTKINHLSAVLNWPFATLLLFIGEWHYNIHRCVIWVYSIVLPLPYHQWSMTLWWRWTDLLYNMEIGKTSSFEAQKTIVFHAFVSYIRVL